MIGADGGIPWHLPEDFAHFKATTLGHTLVMGRATYESIGRPLPGRTTIVVTRDPEWSADGVLVAHSLEEALALAGDAEVFVAGGAAVYEAALPLRRRAADQRGRPRAGGRHLLPGGRHATSGPRCRATPARGSTIVRWERLAG